MGDKKAMIYTIISIALAMAIITLLISVFFTEVEYKIVHIIDNNGYIAILFIAILTDVLVQPIGPDIPLVAGIISGLNPAGSFMMAAVGSFIAGLSSFSLGKFFENKGLRNVYYDKHLAKFNRFFSKNGKTALTIAAVTPIPYVPFCWFAGAFNMKILEFVVFGVLPRTLRLLGVTILVWNIKGLF